MTKKSSGPVKSPMLKDVKPMFSTNSEVPLDERGWRYEVKWDGFRAISYVEKGKVEIRSRNNKSFTEKFYPITQALKKYKTNFVADGEIIVMNEKGYADFEALQTWRSEADGDLVYYIFDLLWLNGNDLTHLPLKERRQILEDSVPDTAFIRKSENFEVKGKDFMSVAHKMGLEGIIAKKEESPYLPGSRTKSWLKIKTQKHQEAVIAGYTRNENSPKLFSALIMGVYEDGELVPIAPVGTGFNTKMQELIMKKLKPLETKKCPFPVEPDLSQGSRFRPAPSRVEVKWVKPKIVGEVTFTTVAPNGAMRHPSFRGLREDKNPEDVKWEVPELIHHKENQAESPAISNKIKGKKIKKERRSLVNPTEETQVRIVGSHELRFTNLSKVFWPKEGITKRDMINFYYQIAPYMLPYIKNRPQTLNRFPHGIEGKSFYQKNVKGKVPEWLDTYEYYSEVDEKLKEFPICNDEESLLYLVNLGCIEINPWSSTSQNPDNPDWCIIDLDPDKNDFNQVIEAARVTHEVFDSIGVPNFCKTSGSTGLHIYVPLGGKKYDYEDSKEFGRAIAKVIHKQLPKFTSIERMTSKRKGKLYIDFLQNRPQATVAGPYSLRPKPGATVSMPLFWDEVKNGLKMKHFTIHNSIDRLKETGDIFGGVLGNGINIEKALKKLESNFPR